MVLLFLEEIHIDKNMLYFSLSNENQMKVLEPFVLFEKITLFILIFYISIILKYTKEKCTEQKFAAFNFHKVNTHR